MAIPFERRGRPFADRAGQDVNLRTSRLRTHVRIHSVKETGGSIVNCLVRGPDAFRGFLEPRRVHYAA
jgi:hypothetical protein